MKTDKRIRTALYGDQRLSSAELEVIHTPAMQRLYGLKQLGLTDRVFIDASHARIHHVVGVLEQVNKLVDAISRNLGRRARKLSTGVRSGPSQIYTAHELANIVEAQRPVIRFIGLLHDLTHAPFGHTVEDEIGIVKSKHDDPERQADAFYRLICQLVAWLSLEALDPDKGSLSPSLVPFLSQCAPKKLPPASEVGAAAKKLISEITKSRSTLRLRLSPTEVAEMFAHLGCSMRALLYLEALHKAKPPQKSLPQESEYSFEEVIRLALEGSEFEGLTKKFQFEPRRDAFMLDIVGNTVCADLLDYAGRDSHFAGLRLDYDPDRIAENFTLVSVDALAYDLNHPQAADAGSPGDGRDADPIRNPFEGWCLRAAISLVSHKYRTDVPSELMNLLNVRYYLYERVIFHPTKCAAGSMLGTALQLLGWRDAGSDVRSGNSRSLPENLRFVGDDIFLHDIGAALDLVLPVVSAVPDEATIGEVLPTRVSDLEEVHSGLVPAIWKLHVGQAAAKAKEELRAARLILNRLRSRRYFRPVFRALPSSIDPSLQAGPEILADLFKQPDLRFNAERQIEKEAGLPTGTITIHCPTRSPAKKIANVFLTKPGSAADGIDDPVCRLKDIASLDGETFGDHQRAVKAVEQMYGSMWRLHVYVAPEYLQGWDGIAQAAGRVIFKSVDIHAHFSELPGREWPNDLSLVAELKGRGRGSFEDSAAKADFTPFIEIMRQIGEGLVSSNRLLEIPSNLYTPGEGLSADGRKRLEDAVVSALTTTGQMPSDASPREKPALRADKVLLVVRTYFARKPKQKDEDSFRAAYSAGLEGLPEDSFGKILSKVTTAISNSKDLDAKDPAHKGYKFPEFRELFDEIYRQFGTKGNLFSGDSDD